jgi:hypothetical protein
MADTYEYRIVDHPPTKEELGMLGAAGFALVGVLGGATTDAGKFYFAKRVEEPVKPPA